MVAVEKIFFESIMNTLEIEYIGNNMNTLEIEYFVNNMNTLEITQCWEFKVIS